MTETEKKVIEDLKSQTTNEQSPALKFYNKFQALSKLMHNKPWLKTGQNQAQRYLYFKEEMYKQFFAEALDEVGLVWTYQCDSAELFGQSASMSVTKATFVGRLIDPETGYSEKYPLVGTGADTTDKGLYKAYTGALKYFLACTFLVAEGNDPETDEVSNIPPAPAKKEEKKPTPPPTPEKREELKESLTAADKNAPKAMITSLKSVLKELKDLEPEKSKKVITSIVEATQNFTVVTKAQCEDFTKKAIVLRDKLKAEKPKPEVKWEDVPANGDLPF